MASACKSLRECERWRGEILREISRKVSKIQDGAWAFLVSSFEPWRPETYQFLFRVVSRLCGCGEQLVSRIMKYET